MTIADLGTRDRALDIHQSFAVSAPAGSGKTGLLTRRILRLLAHCQAPEQILAITFTRKAAAEMRDRVLAALALAQQPTATSDYERAIQEDARAALARDKAEGWALTDNPSRLRIMTIDSLNRVLARQLAAQTGLGTLPEPAEQPDPLYRTAIARLFEELDKSSQESDDLALLLGHLDNNLANLENLLALLLAQREQWLGPLLHSRDARELLESTLQDVVLDCLTGLHQALTPIGSELASLADYAATNLAQYEPSHNLTALTGLAGLPDASAEAANLGQWQALVQLLVTQSGDWRKPAGLNKKLGFPTAKDSVRPEQAGEAKNRLIELLQWCGEQPGLLNLIADLQHLPGTAYSDNQWQLLDALARLLPRLVAELTLVFNEQQACDFTQITLAAHQALGSDDDPTDLALALDYQLQHILVDEFQDTSSIQFSLLRKLIAGWQPDDGRTLFIVGDGMQSLYGFRNANVGLFLEARHQPLGHIQLQPLDLSTNFRSTATIVDWVNRTFATVFPPHEDISRGAVPYAPAQAARPADPASIVSFDVFSADALPEDEARQVVARIQAARETDPEGSIAVLCRARSHLSAILEALHAAGIPWQATDIDPLASRMPVTDLLSLTRALINPADRIAWLAILRAPWCGLNLHDIHTLANSADPADPDALPVFPWLPARLWSQTVSAQLSPAGQKSLVRVAPVLQRAWDNRQRKPLRQWIEGTWLALGGPATLLDSTEMAWCRQYFDLLDRHDTAGTIADMAAFEDAVSRLYAAADSTGDRPVQVMTIHKSKGLEFDTVVIPGLHKGGNSASSTLLHWRERISAAGEEQLLIAPPLSPAEQASASQDSQLVDHLKHEARLKDQLEDARVLYVACTRAIKRLHLLFTDKFSDKGKSPTSGSLLACLWPALENGLESTGAQVQHHLPAVTPSQPEPAAEVVPGGLLRLVPEWQHPLAPTKGYQESQQTAWPAPVSRSQQQRRQLGTVLHRTLCRIVVEGLDNWGPARLERQRKAWQLQLAAGGIEVTEALIATLTQATQTVLADPTGRWLLDHRHQDSQCELPLCHAGDDGLPTVSVIDRLFVDNGTLWVIDYKSSAPEDSESEADFLDRERENYRSQLQRYRQAVADRHQGPAKVALYFPLIPRLVELD